MANIINRINDQKKRQLPNEKMQYCKIKPLELVIRLPNLFQRELERMSSITIRSQNDLITLLIIKRLEYLSSDPEAIFFAIKDAELLLYKLKEGIVQYHGENFYPESKNMKSLKKENKNQSEIKIILEIPPLLIQGIENLCKITCRSMEDLTSYLIISQIEWIYSNPEDLIDYVKNKSIFYKELRLGIDQFFI